MIAVCSGFADQNTIQVLPSANKFTEERTKLCCFQQIRPNPKKLSTQRHHASRDYHSGNAYSLITSDYWQWSLVHFDAYHLYSLHAYEHSRSRWDKKIYSSFQSQSLLELRQSTRSYDNMKSSNPEDLRSSKKITVLINSKKVNDVRWSMHHVERNSLSPYHPWLDWYFGLTVSKN